MTDSNWLIRFEGVGHSFPRSGDILKNINATIAAGDFIALLGPSGSGKTTLLRLAAGLDFPSVGQIRSNLNDPPGYVFQESNLLPWLTVLDNVALPLKIRGIAREDRNAQAQEALKRARLQGVEHLYPFELSGGMKMRAALARALVINSPLLLFDEPFSALDELTREQLQEEIRRLWETTGVTIIFVTHSLREAVFLANSIWKISVGGQLAHPIAVDLPRERPSDLRFAQVYQDNLKRLRESL